MFSRNIVTAALVLGLVPAMALAQTAPTVSGPQSGRAERVGVSEPVRNILARQPATAVLPQPLKSELQEVNKLNTEVRRIPRPGAARGRDGALQSTAAERAGAEVTPLPATTCEGIANADNLSGVNPPDTTGDVGLTHYVQAVNNRVRIFDKTCASVGPAFSMSTLFASIGGICATLNQGDPIVLYDRLADRWLISQFAFASQTLPPWHECIAISQTGDPTGSYFAYDFVVPPVPLPPGGGFPDYPKLGVWPDGYYMTTREFNPGFTGHGAFAFERSKMLLGDPTASFIYFHTASTVSNSSSGMLPTDHDGLLPPPVGAPNMFAILTDDIFGDPADAIRLFDFTPNYAAPLSSTFTERADSPLAVAAFDSRNPFGAAATQRQDIEQPDGVVANRLDSIGDRLIPKLFYINRAGTESWVVGHTVNAGIIPPTPIEPTALEYEAAVRYYELRRTSFPGAVSVNEQGTFSPGTLERWMPSVAMNNQGDLAVGYSTSSAAVGDEPSIAWAARQIGDPAGTLQTEAEMFAGSGIQQGSGNRWGDYTAMSVDPVDDCTFWHTNEYILATGTFNWRTRIGNFSFPACVTPLQGTISGTVTAADTAAPLGGVLAELSGTGPSAGFSDTTDAAGNYSIQVAPGTYTVTFRNPFKNCTPDIVAPGLVVANGATVDQDAVIDGNPVLLKTTHVVTEGNANGIVNRAECNNFLVTVQNSGCGNATSLNGVLSTSTTNVTINENGSAYPDIVINADEDNDIPFQFATTAAFACGTPIAFTLNLGSGPLNFTVPTCTAPPVQFTGSLAAPDPVWTASGRLTRNGVVSSCPAPKAFPGPFNSLGRRFDTHSVSNTGGVTACVNATLSTTCAVGTAPIFSTTYLGSFDPTNLATNYLADAGTSPNIGAPVSWSFDLPAGQTAVFVVNTAGNTSPGTDCAGYTLDVSGLLDNAAGPGETACTTVPVDLLDFEVGKK